MIVQVLKRNTKSWIPKLTPFYCLSEIFTRMNLNFDLEILHEIKTILPWQVWDSKALKNISWYDHNFQLFQIWRNKKKETEFKIIIVKLRTETKQQSLRGQKNKTQKHFRVINIATIRFSKWLHFFVYGLE